MLQPCASEVHPPNGDSEVQSADVQLSAAQDETNWQVTSHAHDGPQLTSLQESRPEQSTLHGPAPHTTVSQLCLPAQVIVHALAFVQMIPLRHAFGVEQAISQLQPVGQVTRWAQALASTAQSIVHVFVAPSHDVHCAGQLPCRASGRTPASSGITHRPSMHTRLPAHLESGPHAKSSLRWLTEQPVASAATPRSESQSTTRVMAYLRT